MLGAGAAAVVLDDVAAFGDAEQHVVRFMVGASCEIALVGGNQGQSTGVGERQQIRLDARLVREAVPLQLDVEPITENLVKRGEPRRGKLCLTVFQRAVDRAVGTTGQGDQPGGKFFDARDLGVDRLVVRRLEVKALRQPHQIGVAVGVGGEKRDAPRRLRPAAHCRRS